MSFHKQTSVLVNTNKGTTKELVEVDEGIKNIIVSLNKFDGLETVESCQGDEDNITWISFKYKYWEHPYRNLVDFVFIFFAPYLAERVGDSVSINIHAASSGNIFAELWISPGTIKIVEIAIEDAFSLIEEAKKIVLQKYFKGE